jgi:transposase-like protein
MDRIVGSITSLAQHLIALATETEVYRPAACPHCRCGTMWGHGCYYRKADRSAGDAQSLNPVPVLRFLCRACVRTCSRLPACIAPRRWYDWFVQQAVLLLLLAGGSVRHCAQCTGRARSTVRRWWTWLHERGEQFAFCLRSRLPELGRVADFASFWRNVIEGLSLQQSMVLLDGELVVP